MIVFWVKRRMMLWEVLFLFAFTLCDASNKALRFRVKNEVIEKDGRNSIVQVDFETGGKAEVTWCRILQSSPNECIPIKDDDGYTEKGKMSLFYFIYMGTSTLRKANDEDVIAFKVTVRMKNGQYIYSHVIPIPEAESAQATKRNVATPKILEAPASRLTFRAGETVHEKCMVESKEPMTVRWFYLPPDDSPPVLLYSGDNSAQGRLRVAAHVSQVAGSLREDTELGIPDAQESDSGIYMCEFTSNVSGDTTQLLGTIQSS